jgi:uncharacterized protein
MQINVSQLLKAPVGAVRNYQVSSVVAIDSGDCQSRPVRGEVSLIRTDRGILVRGTLNSEANVTCSRCLAVFSYQLDFKMEEEYFPTVDTDTGASIAVPGEPGCFVIDEQHMLDLTEAMRQYALLAMPMKPLCRQDCAGLCPECGHNLNRGPCDCPGPTVDPRWAELARLAAEQKGTN